VTIGTVRTREGGRRPGARADDTVDELVVTEAAVKQRLLRIYAKSRILESANRRSRLANEVIGVLRPALLIGQRDPVCRLSASSTG